MSKGNISARAHQLPNAMQSGLVSPTSAKPSQIKLKKMIFRKNEDVVSRFGSNYSLLADPHNSAVLGEPKA